MINALERFYNSAKGRKSWITTIAEILMQSGSTAAASNLFGTVGGAILNALIVSCCLGVFNGLMIAHIVETIRLQYAKQDLSPRPLLQ